MDLPSLGIRMKRRRIPAFTILLWTLLLPHAGAGQEGAFAFQIRGGAAIPWGDFASGSSTWSGESGRGPSFDMGFAFPAPGPIGAYLGFGQRWFPCDDTVCPPGSDWISTGFDLALRQLMGKGKVRLWLQGGVHTHRLEAEGFDEEGNPVSLVSDPGVGFEAGAGLQFRVWTRTALSPGIRYGRGSAAFRDGRELSLDYLILDLGLVFGF